MTWIKRNPLRTKKVGLHHSNQASIRYGRACVKIKLRVYSQQIRPPLFFLCPNLVRLRTFWNVKMNGNRIISTLLKESGAMAVLRSPRDTKLLCVQRFVRLSAYGMSFLILVHYLTTLGIDDAHVGLFMTLTLLGDVLISFCLTLITDKVGRRLVLIVGAGLMSFSGFVFSWSSNYWLLLFASVVGVISPRLELTTNRCNK